MKINVAIFGPNLRDQSRGQFHVHAADCRDCKHYGPGTRYGGEVMKLDAVSKEDVVRYIYADIMAESLAQVSESEMHRTLEHEVYLTFEREVHFAPCLAGALQ